MSARHRTRTRAAERGAALFIVVLVIVLLTAIGVFAVHAASMAQAASGYSRRAAAAFYLGEFAMNVVASDMAGKESEYLQLASTGTNDCRATAGLGGPTGLLATAGAQSSIITCRGIEFNQMTQLMDPAIVADSDGPVFGALNRPDSPSEQTILGSFRVEMTDVGPGPNPQAGMAMNGVTPTNVWQTAFTTTARIVPQTAAGNCSPDATRASESQSLRGYVTFTTVGTPPPGALAGP